MTPETWLNVWVKVDSEGTLHTEAASSLFIAVGWECVALGGVVACGQETAYGTPPMAELVTQRLRGAFGPTYLTLMSVIQGVAMAALATRVGDTADRLTLADWILVGNTFPIFVAIWNEYLVAALA